MRLRTVWHQQHCFILHSGATIFVALCRELPSRQACLGGVSWETGLCLACGDHWVCCSCADRAATNETAHRHCNVRLIRAVEYGVVAWVDSTVFRVWCEMRRAHVG